VSEYPEIDEATISTARLDGKCLVDFADNADNNVHVLGYSSAVRRLAPDTIFRPDAALTDAAP
jgi:hypothetical protein